MAKNVSDYNLTTQRQETELMRLLEAKTDRRGVLFLMIRTLKEEGHRDFANACRERLFGADNG